ncbi:hypothetical protein HanIR_Chr02g0074181 [Helianthus annuus]|nr:hypothetical protein HanIR_Chr02g0074181 [Helianthus annuus]
MVNGSSGSHGEAPIGYGLGRKELVNHIFNYGVTPTASAYQLELAVWEAGVVMGRDTWNLNTSSMVYELLVY